jgi:hypothetical protein
VKSALKFTVLAQKLLLVKQKVLSLHMQTHNGVSTNMSIVYVAPVQNKAGIHFMVNLSDHDGRWFSPGTPVFSTTKTGSHEIAEILLKVALNTTNQSIKSIRCTVIDLYELLDNPTT